MLKNAPYNDCQNYEEYRQRMEKLIATATYQLNLSNVSSYIVILIVEKLNSYFYCLLNDLGQRWSFTFRFVSNSC